MQQEFVIVWQREYGPQGVREVWYEADSEYEGLRDGCQATVKNHGGVIHFYEINNNGTLTKLHTFGEFHFRTELPTNPLLWRETT